MTAPIPFAEWEPRLAAALAQHWRVRCVESCDSTQDEARGEPPGSVVVAWRQCAGRGRLGRAWHDSGTDGVAMTVNLAVERLDQLPIAAGIAVAEALESLGARGVRLKWPNDVHCGERKVAGMLVEASDGIARLGIGINVTQRSWPDALSGIATSLAEHGIVVDRLDVIAATLSALVEAIARSDAQLRDGYLRRDALIGTRRTLCVGDTTVTGTVEALDPFGDLLGDPSGSIRVRRDDGTVVALDLRHVRLESPTAPSRA